ncbi:hypothetical protein OHR68_09200 [Spirillospora sp. NBC_00431]
MTLLFERVYGAPPATTRYVRGSLPLLDGLDVPLPWGAAVAAARSGDGTTSLFSMNHHDHGVVTPSTAAAWADDCLKAVDANPAPGTNLLVNRELPAEMGLLTGAETTEATTRALRDVHDAVPATRPAPRRSCSLSGAGLRVLLIEVGSRHPPAVPPADPETPARVRAALLAGRPADLGPILIDAHAPGNPAHDDALEAALDAGALGGRTIGTCVAALAPESAVPAIRARVTARLAPSLHRPPRYLIAG